MVLLERHLTVDDALKVLKLQHAFQKLNRSTLYRWSYVSDASVPPRAYFALETLRQPPTIGASNETIQQWMDKLTALVDQLGKMQMELKILAAQISFQKKQ